MMSKILSRFLAVLSVAVPFAASAEGTAVIGYCNGEVAKTSVIGDNTGSDCIEAASLFPASLFEKYENLEICGVNVGLASRLNVSEVSVWIRESLDGGNIFEATLTKDEGISKGWNAVAGTPSMLPDGKDVYVGYTLSLTGASFPVSSVGEDHEGGLWVNTTGEWKDMSSSGLGTLSVELVATASNLVQYDLTLRQLELPESIRIGATVPLILKVYNAGAMPVSGFGVECSIEGYPSVKYDVEQYIEPNGYADVELEYSCPMTEKSPEVSMTVDITDIVEGEDGNPTDNRMTAYFSVNRFDFKKVLLMEEFSTEKCTFCPQGAAILHNLINEPENEGRILAIANHVGFYTDWLTVPVSNNYLWFYDGGSGATYAPAFMYDRYSFGDKTPVCSATEDYSSVKQKAAERLAVIPMVALEAAAEYDSETSELNVHIDGERFEGYEGDRLTVCIVENEIPARRQSGADGPFTHQHVLRDVNEIWGDIIEWDLENNFSHDVSFYVNPTWKKENLQVIAFVSKYNPKNYMDCTVENACQAAIEWHGGDSGILAPVAVDGEAEYFTLDGIRVDSPVKGIYIVRRGTRMSKEFVR